MYMCFAGMEDKSARDLARRIGQKHILMSYYYLRSKVRTRKAIEELKEELAWFDTVLIDSGAFTFMNSGTSFSNVGENDTEGWLREIKKYVCEYADFLGKMQGHVTAAFEMDYDTGVGSEQCWEYYEILAKSGVRILPVYHGDNYSLRKDGTPWVEDTPKLFEAWCKKYDYVAIGSSFFQKPELKSQAQMLLRIAKKHKTRVHGLGVTSYKDITVMPLYSIDSTSWLSGDRFGATFFFQNGRVKSYDKNHKDVRKRWKSQCDKYDIDFGKLNADDTKEVRAWNAFQWKLFADAMNEQHRNRKMEYWLGTRLEGKMAENLEPLEERYEEKDIEVVTEDEGEDDDFFSKKELIITPEAQLEIDRKAEKLASRGIMSNPNAIVSSVPCDGCYLGDRCPYYKENATCQIGLDVTLTSGKDMVALMQTLLEIQTERALRGAFVEKMDGGMINETVSKELDRTMGMMQRVKEMSDNREEVTITAKGSGILAQIFGAKSE